MLQPEVINNRSMSRVGVECFSLDPSQYYRKPDLEPDPGFNFIDE